MLKKKLTLILAAAVIALSGCNNSQTAQTTTIAAAAPSEAWEYELYIEDLDYFMNKYFQNYFPAKNAMAIMDAVSLKDYLENALEVLAKLKNVIYPPNLEEVHSKFLYDVDLAEKLMECNLKLADYIARADSLTDEDYGELEVIYAEAKDILAKMDESGGILTAWFDAQEEAFSYLPNGEYKAYSAELESVWDIYVTEINLFIEVFFNGTTGDAVKISNDCLSLLSRIENIEAPEQLKTYHDDISKAVQTERNLYDTVISLVALNDEYRDVAFEDRPVVVQEQTKEYSKTIDSFFNEENTEYYALYDAVCAALDFADAQAGQ